MAGKTEIPTKTLTKRPTDIQTETSTEISAKSSKATSTKILTGFSKMPIKTHQKSQQHPRQIFQLKSNRDTSTNLKKDSKGNLKNTCRNLKGILLEDLSTENSKEIAKEIQARSSIEFQTETNRNANQILKQISRQQFWQKMEEVRWCGRQERRK
ncbi:unnamed protein product [Blepharisma stoltei]|uniref:Uncharacterized protein n=1 Tax=Blepharisma stoltei TaxID=1481888 RepID=A0AAU9JMR3_9CILI|nr:unnamed protein product [Blepharisma stoltei]